MGVPRGIDMMVKFAKIRAFLIILNSRVGKSLKALVGSLRFSVLRGEDAGVSGIVAAFILLILIIGFVLVMNRLGITVQQVISDFEKFFGMVVMNGR